MIKNIGNFTIFSLLTFIALSPFTLIYIKVNEGENSYYLLLIMIIFFLPSIIDLLQNRENEVFSLDNLSIGLLGVIASGILSLIAYFTGELSSIVFISCLLIIPIELLLKHSFGKSDRCE